MSTIHISIVGGPTALELEVEPTQTLAQVKELALEKDSSLETARYTYGKTFLEDDSKTLTDYDILEGSLITVEILRKATTAKRRPRCSFPSCTSAPLRLVGDCSSCQGHFCSRHRLLEQHTCSGLQSCKQNLHQRNANRLHDQQTVASKV